VTPLLANTPFTITARVLDIETELVDQTASAGGGTVRTITWKEGNTGSVPSGGTLVRTAVVKDNGVAVQGVALTIAIASSAHATRAPASGSTDVNGELAVTLTWVSAGGPDNLTATDGTVTSAACAITAAASGGNDQTTLDAALVSSPGGISALGRAWDVRNFVTAAGGPPPLASAWGESTANTAGQDFTQATGADQPATQNNTAPYGSLNFTGHATTPDYTRTADETAAFDMNAGGFTAYLVAEIPETTDARYVFFLAPNATPSQQQAILTHDVGGTKMISAINGTSFTSSAVAVGAGFKLIVLRKVAGAPLTIEVLDGGGAGRKVATENGSEWATGAAVRITLGAEWPAGPADAGATCKVKALRIYRGVSTPAEDALVRTWAQTNHGAA
jgi:hypothetical protein